MRYVDKTSNLSVLLGSHNNYRRSEFDYLMILVYVIILFSGKFKAANFKSTIGLYCRSLNSVY